MGKSRLVIPLFGLVGLVGCERAPEQSRADFSASRPTAAGVPGLLNIDWAAKRSTMTAGELEALGAEDVKDHGQVYRGVKLDRVLLHLGFEPGPSDLDMEPRNRRPGWKKVLVASSVDGIEAVFTLAEIMPVIGPTRAWICWSSGGKQLPSDEGPLRLVVTTDRVEERNLQQLTSLRVFDVRTVKQE